MILVGQYDSPFVRRIAVALHWYGRAFRRNTQSVFADADAMRRINPLGRIPSLILDDGEVLVDSFAIQDFLDEDAAPDRRLTPKNGPERRHVLRLSAMAAGAADKAGAIVYERTLRPPEKQFDPWIARCSVQLASALTHLDVQKGGPWLGGERLSQADIMAGCLIGYLRLRLPEAAPLGRYRGLDALHDRLQTCPEFAKTAPQSDEAMPAGLGGR
jgi:glutathione S-transferase